MREQRHAFSAASGGAFAILLLLCVSGRPISSSSPLLSSPLFTEDGRTMTLGDLRGHVVVVAFCSTQMVACLDETLFLDALSRERGQSGLVAVMVTEGPTGRLRDLVRDFGFPASDAFINAHENDAHVLAATHAHGFPVTIVLSPSGEITHIFEGRAILHLATIRAAAESGRLPETP